jgi:hypothetical protein
VVFGKRPRSKCRMIEKFILRRIEKRALKLGFKPSISIAGVQLYQPIDPMELHATRLPELYRCITFLSTQIDQKDIDTIISLVDQSLNNTVNDQPKPRLTVLAATVEELKHREQMVSVNTVYELIALINLTEDECKSGGKFNKYLHDYKVGLLENGKGFFLQKSGLIELLNSLNKYTQSEPITLKELEEEMGKSQIYFNRLKQVRQKHGV